MKTIFVTLLFFFAFSSYGATSASKQKLPTKLPQKSALGTTGEQSSNRVSTAIVLPASMRPVRYLSTTTLAFGAINGQQADLRSRFFGSGPYQDTRFATLTPQVTAEFPKGLNAYGNLPVTWTTPSDMPQSRILGRPEIGMMKGLDTGNSNLHLALMMAVKLPVFECLNCFAPDLQRTWEFAPGVTVDSHLGQSANHFLGAAGVAYNTHGWGPTGFETTTETVFERPIAIRTALGVSHDAQKMAMGVGIRTNNEIGHRYWSATAGGSVQGSPLDLLSGEVFASYRFNDETKLGASLRKGLKVASDDTALAGIENPQDIADSSLAVGLTQSF